MCCVPYYSLLTFFSLFLILITFLLGDICLLAFDTGGPGQPSQIGPILYNTLKMESFKNFTSSPGSIMQECVNGETVVGVLSEFGFDTSQFNFSEIAVEQINKFNFSDAANFDLRYLMHYERLTLLALL